MLCNDTVVPVGGSMALGFGNCSVTRLLTKSKTQDTGTQICVVV